MIRRAIPIERTLRWALVSLGLALPLAFAADAGDTPSLAMGEAVFVAKGCYQCHGREGNGAMGVGSRLAPPRQSFERFRAYLREPSGVMPPYSAKLLPDDEVQSVYAFLLARPAGPTASDIPLLARYAHRRTSPEPVDAPKNMAGDQVYRRYCAGCHGVDREGGVGPALIREAARRNIDETLALIRNPPAGMPKLVPPLSDDDLKAVGKFIRKEKTAR